MAVKNQNEMEDIETILILVQLKNGNAHQVLSSPEDKNLMLHLLANMQDKELKLSKEIYPIKIK